VKPWCAPFSGLRVIDSAAVPRNLFSKGALNDLGVPADQRDSDIAAEGNSVIARFFKHYSVPGRVDRGVPIGEVEHPKVFRIRDGYFRGAVWYDQDGGVVWLCRVLSLANFPSEPDLYREFRSFEERGVLFPSQGEIGRERGIQYLYSVVDALNNASLRAYEDPLEWQRAEVVRPDGTKLDVGRARVERIDLGGGEGIIRVVIVNTEHPTDLELPTDWLAVIMADCFPSPDEVPGAEDVHPVYRDLPRGTNLQRHEIPLVQCEIVEEPFDSGDEVKEGSPD
jgi:hypothetical protein